MIGQRPSLRHRIQGGIARVLKRLGFDQLGWDVATFSPTAGHFCVRCAKRSHTEREHLTHACRFARRHTVHDALGITPEHAAWARREWGDCE